MVTTNGMKLKHPEKVAKVMQQIEACDIPDREPTHYIPLRSLFIDPNVQRALNENWVKKLVKNFDPDKFGIIVVSERAPGKYAVIEGQHRIAAVRSLFNDENQMVECKIHRGLKPHEEAALFLAETDKLGMTVLIKFQQRVRACDPEAVAINEIVRQEGFRISNPGGVRTMTCVSALTNIYRGFNVSKEDSKNPALLRQTLCVMREAWGEQPHATNGQILTGLALLIAYRSKVMDFPDLIHRMRTFAGGSATLLGRARGLTAITGARIPISVAEVLIETYNKQRRLNRLESLRA